jgi:hypothetical protein
LRDSDPQYDTRAHLPCMRSSKNQPTPLLTHKSAGMLPAFFLYLSADLVAGRYSPPSPSRCHSPPIIDLSLEDTPPAPDHSPDVKSILKDGYPLQTLRIPQAGSDRLPLAEWIALDAEANLATMLSLKSHSAARAAEAEMTAAELKYDAARTILRVEQANLKLNLNRRRQAWEALEKALDEDALRSPSPPATLALHPSRTGRKGKGKRSASELGDGSNDQPEDAGGVSKVDLLNC